MCECCKNDILEANLAICPLCKSSVAAKTGKCPGREVSGREGLSDCDWISDHDWFSDYDWREWMCPDCEVPFFWLGVVGWREGALAKVIKDFKYESVRAAGEVLAELMDARLPRDLAKVAGEAEGEADIVGSEVVVVPLPTIGRHVRERGLDHTLMIAKKLARRRGWKCERLLGRATDTVQVGTKAAERREQAAQTYEVRGKVEVEKIYLLVDDVWTTGATMLAAEKVLREAGARRIAGIVLATGR